jgi:hypothetical protein
MRSLTSYHYPSIAANAVRLVYRKAVLEHYLWLRDVASWKSKRALDRLRVAVFYAVCMPLCLVALGAAAILEWVACELVLPRAHRDAFLQDTDGPIAPSINR